MRFYLGVHEPAWLTRVTVPLCVSRRRLARRKRLPRAHGEWGLDSGAFSELSLHHEWRTRPAIYASEVRSYHSEIGGMSWAAIQDWMCEPEILRFTGLSVGEHQRRTVESYLELRETAPGLPWMPVLQGWVADDYLRHWEAYERAGIRLSELPIVGLGSVCRRQATTEIGTLLGRLQGLPLHGFGVKTSGLTAYGWALRSVDSLAWSYHARRRPPLPGCTHASCANCLDYALHWRACLLDNLTRGRLPFWEVE